MKDLIDREAALNCYHDWVDQYGDVHTPDEIPEYQAIEALPSAQPERMRGRWIRQDNKGKPLYGWYQCSECGAVIGGKTNFCSECGADMTGGEQDEL